MSLARRLLARALAPLAWLATGCSFDAFGLGSTSEVDLAGTTVDSTDTTGAVDSSGTTVAGTSTGSMSTTAGSSGSTGGEPCPDGCPPMAAWTVAGDGVGWSLVIDGAGDAIVGGELRQTDDATHRDVWVAKFAGTDGALVWQTRHAGAGKRSDFAHALALAADGTIIAVGGSREDADRRLDLWVGWIAPADGALVIGSNLSTGQWNGDEVKLDEWAEGVVITEVGDIVVGGMRCQVPCQVPDGWIGRFTGAGKPMWPNPMLSVGQGGVRDVTIQAGELVAVGTDGYEGSMAPWRSVVRRFNGDGAGTWSALQEATGDGVGFEATAAAVGPDGGLWVVGRESEPIGGFVRLYMPGSDDDPVLEAHAEQLGGRPAAITIADDGTLVLAGSAGDGIDRHLWFGRFAADLSPLWAVDEPKEFAREARGVVPAGDGAWIVLGLRDIEPGVAPSWLRKYTLPPI